MLLKMSLSLFIVKNSSLYFDEEDYYKLREDREDREDRG